MSKRNAGQAGELEMKDIRFHGGMAVIVMLFTGAAVVQGDEAATRARAMLAKYAGSYDTDALLKEPAVRAELQTLLGAQMNHLESNLNVKGSVDLIGQTLSVSGNAPHQGTEEEAVVCVVPFNMIVEAAILSEGAVTVFTRAEKYEYATLCIKDWVTLANSGHVDRLAAPANVRVLRPR
jgi:hypothetical protein